MSSSSSYLLSNIFDVKSRIVLVTGGGTGIGLYMAQGLATNGAKVYIGGRRKEVLEKAAAGFQSELGGSLVPLTLDVTSKESIANAVKTIETTDGKLDALINNAAIMGAFRSSWADPNSPERKEPFTVGSALFESDSFEEWDEVLRANTVSLYFVTLAFLELLQKGSKDRAEYSASVINITSYFGSTKPSYGHIPYSISKGAANHLTKMLAADLAQRNVRVRVNAVAPGVFVSEMSKPWIAGETMTPEEVNIASGTLLPLPAARAGKEEEMAGAAIYLISPAGYYTNGQVFSVDGGHSISNITTN